MLFMVEVKSTESARGVAGGKDSWDGSVFSRNLYP